MRLAQVEAERASTGSISFSLLLSGSWRRSERACRGVLGPRVLTMDGGLLTGMFPAGSDGEESACNVGDPGFDPWARKISWRRAWQPTPVLLPGEPSWTEEPGGPQSTASQRVGHD